MRSLILILFAWLHSPSAFSQTTTQQGYMLFGQSGVLQIGPTGMELIVPDARTGAVSIPLQDTGTGGLTTTFPTYPDVTSTPVQQQLAGTAQPEQPFQQQQPMAVTCECNCPEPQAQVEPTSGEFPPEAQSPLPEFTGGEIPGVNLASPTPSPTY